MFRVFASLIITACLAVSAVGKDQPIVVSWPESGTAQVRFTLFKVTKIGGASGQTNYGLDMAAENLSGKKISKATFNFFLFDKNNVRVGQGYIDLANMRPKEIVKMQVMALAVGTPVNLTIDAAQLPPELAGDAPPKQISITVYSIPAGAKLKADGNEVGVTPVAVNLKVGSHKLEFTKEGFNSGTYPLMVTAEQVSGGTITYELGTSAHDTIELRDGTVLTGDVESVTATTVDVALGGQIQSFNRNRVKRISLVERMPATPEAK
jgi:PEGA domain